MTSCNQPELFPVVSTIALTSASLFDICSNTLVEAEQNRQARNKSYTFLALNILFNYSSIYLLPTVTIFRIVH